MPHHSRPQGEAPGSPGAGGGSLYCGFRGKGWVRQGEQAEDWLAGVISADSDDGRGTGAWSVKAFRQRRWLGIRALDWLGYICKVSLQDSYLPSPGIG